MTTVRLLGYNIRSMRDDGVALAHVIQGLRPDVVCVQEAPRLLGWRRQRRELSGRVGLVAVTGRRAAGLEVYTGPRVTVLHREHHLLSRVPGMHRRGLALCVLDVEGVRLVAASIHLDLAARPRHTHAGEIVERLDRVRAVYDAPVVVAGDVNERPGGAAWELFTKRFQDGYATAPSGAEFTYSAARPRRRIDAVFADPGIEVVACGVPADPDLLADYPRASDHRPVLAELRLT